MEPDEPFHNFEAIKSVARRSWTTQSSSIHGVWGSKIGKGLVGSQIQRLSFFYRDVAWTFLSHPTDPFTILEPQNPPIRNTYVVRKRRSTNFGALKLRKVRSGCLDRNNRYIEKPRHVFFYSRAHKIDCLSSISVRACSNEHEICHCQAGSTN